MARSAFAPEVTHEAGAEQAKESEDADAREHDECEMQSRKARACADEGRLAEASVWCEKAIAADKLNPAHYFMLAAICQEQGQSERAERSLGRALYLDPDFALAHFALGNLCLSGGGAPAGSAATFRQCTDPVAGLPGRCAAAGGGRAERRPVGRNRCLGAGKFAARA
jgi:tetratricopeptide (TPR) repeat protein